MSEKDEVEADPEWRRQPRVDLRFTAQQHAVAIDSRLDEARHLIQAVPIAAGASSTYPKMLAECLIRDSQSILEGMEHRNITAGSPRIVSNLLRAVELLEMAGTQYEAPVKQLLSVVSVASQHGLTLDGCSLTGKRSIRSTPE